MTSVLSQMLDLMPQFDFLIYITIRLQTAFSVLTLLVGWQEGHLACKN